MTRIPALRLAATLLLAACAPSHSRTPVEISPPAEVLGQFTDDYGNAFRISARLFEQLPHGRFHIVEWHVDERFFIAENDAGNPSDAGRWTRIDWMPFENMAPFAWGFCMTAYRAASRDEARATPAANRATPRTGCNGHPFSRMQRTK